ncbi:MAG: hypothetical protein AAF772_20625 [Acidobacteriota bacterium]
MRNLLLAFVVWATVMTLLTVLRPADGTLKDAAPATVAARLAPQFTGLGAPAEQEDSACRQTYDSCASGCVDASGLGAPPSAPCLAECLRAHLQCQCRVIDPDAPCGDDAARTPPPPR